MTSTRVKTAKVFIHVLTNVLRLTENDQLWLAIEEDGYNSIIDIATLQDDEINELEYTDATSGETVKVVKKQRK